MVTILSDTVMCYSPKCYMAFHVNFIDLLPIHREIFAFQFVAGLMDNPVNNSFYLSALRRDAVENLYAEPTSSHWPS